ncbi:MAG TPA: response regulator [Synergistaceae bacterium]|nr:response regulator [Synergistaceae bacterium]HQF91991.1 response regulator [Synergistaceae bacterium]HQH78802.1 response regulator [Synergistaceae bacterium]HQK24782.1 response regulator [Synergistaceae bacterium]
MGHRILVTDDTAFMRLLLQKILTEGGYDVVGEADNGKEAVRLFERHRPDLVTMDITMPILNGVEALKRIRAVDPDARVLMVSAMGQKNMVMQALREGAQGFLIKPFEKEKVLQAVAEVLATPEDPPSPETP